ncbi:hypothetical protein C8R45DRAFT_511836 [Mycena sanguinolenta]|nr:hypothetical protein C8R45DRAFT_511836 [Mycena sanguinolenta]
MKHPYRASTSSVSSDEVLMHVQRFESPLTAPFRLAQSDIKLAYRYSIPPSSPLEYDRAWLGEHTEEVEQTDETSHADDKDQPPIPEAGPSADVEGTSPPRKISRFRTLSHSALRSIRKHPLIIPPVPTSPHPETESTTSGWDETDSSSSLAAADDTDSSAASVADNTETGTNNDMPLVELFPSTEILVPPLLTDDSEPSPATSSPAPKSLVFRIKGKNDAALDQPPVPIPYTTRQSERSLANKKHDVWRHRVANIMCL